MYFNLIPWVERSNSAQLWVFLIKIHFFAGTDAIFLFLCTALYCTYTVHNHAERHNLKEEACVYLFIYSFTYNLIQRPLHSFFTHPPPTPHPTGLLITHSLVQSGKGMKNALRVHRSSQQALKETVRPDYTTLKEMWFDRLCFAINRFKFWDFVVKGLTCFHRSKPLDTKLIKLPISLARFIVAEL